MYLVFQTQSDEVRWHIHTYQYGITCRQCMNRRTKMSGLKFKVSIKLFKGYFFQLFGPMYSETCPAFAEADFAPESEIYTTCTQLTIRPNVQKIHTEILFQNGDSEQMKYFQE